VPPAVSSFNPFGVAIPCFCRRPVDHSVPARRPSPFHGSAVHGGVGDRGDGADPAVAARWHPR
jgi:hypothetical protein